MPQPAGHSRQVVAYQVSTPGIVLSEGITRETSVPACSRLQPTAPAALARPATLRKSRRLNEASIRSFSKNKIFAPPAHALAMARRAVERGLTLLVAGNAPAHRQTLDALHALHRLHRPVAALAFQAGRHMALVRKVNVVDR